MAGNELIYRLNNKKQTTTYAYERERARFDILIDLVLTIDEKKIFTILEITNLDWAKFLENSKQ